MSKIIEKAFDASKKIFRSVFLGSPNLITSPDLNRQLEAFKYQLDQLDEKVGFLSDWNPTLHYESGTLEITYKFTYLEFKGCSFNPSNKGQLASVYLDKSNPIYIGVKADKELVTYDSDFTHEVAGAKFEDGTSLPAANQWVYKNDQLFVATINNIPANVVGIISKISLADDGYLVVQDNFVPKDSSVLLRDSTLIRKLYPTSSGDLHIGMTHDEAFGIINNRANPKMVVTWENFVRYDFEGNVDATLSSQYKIANNNLCIFMDRQRITQITTRYGALFTRLGEFKEPIKTQLINYFKKMGFEGQEPNYSESGLSSGGFIPFGTFGTFTIHSPYGTTSSGDTVYPMLGQLTICLMLDYNNDDPEDTGIANVYLGGYITSLVETAADYADWNFGVPPIDFMPLNRLSSSKAGAFIPSFYGSIQLPGLI